MARSTRALFRATKPKPRDGDGFAADWPEARAPEAERRADDFYPTGQPEAIRALMAAEWPRLEACGAVWDPAVGDGALAREMAAAGLTIIASDLRDRGWPGTRVASYYDFDRSLAPAIITNPPYSEINARDGHGRWLRHTLDMGGWEYCALLLSWDWPAARKNGLGPMLDRHPFSRCYLMRWKLDFSGEGSPPQRNGWFIWDRDDPRATDGSLPHPEFRWLDRDGDLRQGSLL